MEVGYDEDCVVMEVLHHLMSTRDVAFYAHFTFYRTVWFLSIPN